MPVMHLSLELPAWPDLAGREVIDYQDPISVCAIPGGMDTGATAVAMRFDLPDGQVLVAQTSLALWLAIGRGIVARYPSPPGTGENAP